MVAWNTAYRLMELGGLGIADLKLAESQATRCKPIGCAWSQLPLDVESQVQAFFQASTYTELGDMKTMLF
jgi:hypothetical protein